MLMVIIGTVFLMMAIGCWVLCYLDSTSGNAKAGLFAWVLKYPATVFTVIGVLAFIIEAVSKQ